MNRTRALTILAFSAVAALLVLGTTGVLSQQPSPPLLQTVNDRILASHGVFAEPAGGPAGRSPDDATVAAIKSALVRWGDPPELAETPRLVQFKEAIPGIPETGKGPLWAVVLSAQPSFGGGPRGFKPHPDSTGTYWVAFYSAEADSIVYSIAGEKVLK